jgi:hypothetical protein
VGPGHRDYYNVCLQYREEEEEEEEEEEGEEEEEFGNKRLN